MQRNVAGQKLTVFAWTRSTGAPKIDDQANIVCFVSIDGGPPTVLTDTNPTQVDSMFMQGYYEFDLTAAETNGFKLLFVPQSDTSDVNVMATPPVIYTNFDTNVTSVDGDTDAAISLRIAARAEGLTDYVAGPGSTTSNIVITDPYDADLEDFVVGNLLVFEGQCREVTAYANGGSSAELTVSPPYTDAPLENAPLLLISNHDTSPKPDVRGAGYLGDFAAGDTVIIPFTTAANGVATSPVGMTATLVRDGAVTLGDTGVTLTIEYGGTPGSHYAVVSSSVASLTTAHDYTLEVDEGTVGGVDVSGAVLGAFSIGNRPAGAGAGGITRSIAVSQRSVSVRESN